MVSEYGISAKKYEHAAKNIVFMLDMSDVDMPKNVSNIPHSMSNKMKGKKYRVIAMSNLIVDCIFVVSELLMGYVKK